MSKRDTDVIATPAQLSAALDRWGSRLHTWPTAAAEAAQQLLERSAEARELLSEAEALDRLLAPLGHQPAPPDLQQRIVDAIRAPIADRLGDWLANWFGSALWRPALAAALPLAFGFAAGLAVPQDNADPVVDLTEQLALLAFNAPEETFDDAQ